MDEEDARQALETVKSELDSGYAYDIIDSILNGQGGERDDDSLFRTLVLDEGLDVDEATNAYRAAGAMIKD